MKSKAALPGKVVSVDGQAEVHKTLQEPDQRSDDKNDPHPWTPEVVCHLLQGELAAGSHGGALLRTAWL